MQAQKIRRHRQEYDTLAEVIQQHPARSVTVREMSQRREELSALEHETFAIEGKLQLRKKQFRVLMHAVREIQQTLEGKTLSGVLWERTTMKRNIASGVRM